MSSSVVFLITLVPLVLGANFPVNDVPRCKMEDNTCIKNTINNVIFPKFSQGLPSLGLPSVEPLNVDKLLIEQGGNGPITVKLFFKDIVYSGFSNTRFTKFEGPGKKLDGGRFNFDIEGPAIIQIATYKINGKVLVLPITGSGVSNMTFERPILKFRSTTKSVVRDNVEYMQIDKVKINIVPARLWMNFSNLFNGNKELGDNMNLFLNNNWKDIYGELKNSIQGSFSGVIKNTVNQVFNTVPYNQLFLE